MFANAFVAVTVYVPAANLATTPELFFVTWSTPFAYSVTALLSLSVTLIVKSLT